jgi:tetratricopeptide (TPR) repeat protein
MQTGDLDIFGGLERLVEHNLIRQEAGIEADPRFTMLQTIREFGLEQLQTVSDAAEVRSRHATFFLELSEAAEAQRRGPDQGTWRQRLETEHDNLRAALSWLIETDAEMALLLARLLSDFWLTRGHLREGRAWLERVLVAGEQAPPRARMAVLNALASIAGPQGDYERVATAAEEALGYARDLGETGEAAWSLMMLGGVAFISGDYSRAIALTQEALELRRTLDQKTNVALILMNLSAIAMAQTDYGRAGAYLDEALQLMRGAGNEEVLAKVLESMGWLALKQNQYAQAALLLRESLALCVKVGARRQVAECMRGLAEVALLIGQPGQSARLHAAAHALREEVGAALEPAERAEYEQSVAATREVLGEDVFVAAWEEGCKQPLDQVVAEALTFGNELAMSTPTRNEAS